MTGTSKRAAGRYRYVFGPVPSRRLGRSLGLDLVPFKTCSLNCLFCQLGSTPNPTLRRMDYVPVPAVIDEFDRWLAEDGEADAVTLSGSGEPTLHAHFGRVLQLVEERCALRRVLLSNGSLFADPAVRFDAMHGDVVKCSMSAWDQASFEAVNRPSSELSFEHIVAGLRAFRKEFDGEYWIEVVLLRDINDQADGIARIADIVDGIGADRVHLNTVVRPPAHGSARAVTAAALRQAAAAFKSRTEIIATFTGLADERNAGDNERILSLLSRRPCTVQDIAGGLGVASDEVERTLERLMDGGFVQRVTRDRGGYYRATERHDTSAIPQTRK